MYLQHRDSILLLFCFDLHSYSTHKRWRTLTIYYYSSRIKCIVIFRHCFCVCFELCISLVCPNTSTDYHTIWQRSSTIFPAICKPWIVYTIQFLGRPNSHQRSTDKAMAGISWDEERVLLVDYMFLYGWLISWDSKKNQPRSICVREIHTKRTISPWQDSNRWWLPSRKADLSSLNCHIITSSSRWRGSSPFWQIYGATEEVQRFGVSFLRSVLVKWSYLQWIFKSIYAFQFLKLKCYLDTQCPPKRYHWPTIPQPIKPIWSVGLCQQDNELCQMTNTTQEPLKAQPYDKLATCLCQVMLG